MCVPAFICMGCLYVYGTCMSGCICMSGAYVCLGAYGDYRTTSGGIPQVPNTLVFETGLSLAWSSPNTLLRCLASEPQESAWLHIPHPYGFNMDSGA